MKTLQNGLKKWAKKNNMKPTQAKQKEHPVKQKTEEFSERDIKELMGMNMRTYHRGKGGSLHQR